MSPIYLLSGFAASLTIAVSLTPIVRAISLRLQVLDSPEIGPNARRVHAIPTSRLGGVGIYLGFLFPILFIYQDSTLSKIAAVSLCTFVIGFWDDLFNVSPKVRFGVQIAVGLFTSTYLDIPIDRLPFSTESTIVLPPPLGHMLTTFIIVGAINSLNMIDGLDGLAGGIGVISILMLTYLYFTTTGRIEAIILLTLPVIGSILGFLRYNTYPASIFMGDSGSNWLGFMIGIFIVINLTQHDLLASTGELKASSALVTTILCFAVPIFDTLLVIISRLRQGVSPMHSDQRHFHHTLLRIGLNQSQSVICIYFLSICSAIAGLLPVLYPRYNLTWAPVLWSIFLITIIPISVYINSSQIERVKEVKNSLVNFLYLSRKLNIVFFIWEKINKYCLFSILVFSPIIAGTFSANIGYLAVTSICLMFISLSTGKFRNDFFESIAVTAACLTLLIANNHSALKISLGQNIYNVQDIYNSLFVFLACSTLTFVMLTLRRKYLILSPSDFLMSLVPLLILLLPEDTITEYRLDIISLRSLVIFICYKTLEKRRRTAHRHLKLAILLSLTYVAAVSLLEFKVIYQ